MKEFVERHARFFDYLSYQVVQVAVGLVAIPILTRLVSIEQYGLISLAGTISVMVFAAAYQWMQFVVGRGAAALAGGELAAAMIGSVEVLGSLLIGSVAVVGIAIALELSATLSILLLLLVPIHASLFIGMEFLYMRQRSAEYRRLGNAYSILKQTLGIVLVAMASGSAENYVSGWLAATAVSALLLFRVVGWRRLFGFGESSLSGAWKRIAFGYPFAFAGILEVSAVFIPSLLLAANGAVGDIGRFGVIWTVATGAVYLVPSVYVFNRFPPLLAEYDRGDIRRFREGAWATTKRGLLLATLLSFVFSVAGPAIIELFAGNAYRVEVWHCGIAALHFTAMLGVRALSFHYKASKLSGRMSFFSFIATGAMCLVAVDLIPRLGFAGALIGCAVWSLVLFSLQATDLHRRYRLAPAVAVGS